MEIIIAAIAVAVLLLWGGILGLLRTVDFFERRHILGLGAFTTLVTGLVMGLVLFAAHERQKEHRRELREQMDGVTKRLSDLSERLVGQLAEKADLTASEFEIRARLQNETAHHERTRQELARSNADGEELGHVLSSERKASRVYQSDVNSKLEQRFAKEEERYRGIKDFLDVHRRLVQQMQKQLGTLQDDASSLKTNTAALETNQNGLLGKLSAAREIGDLNSQKIDAVARSQAALYDDLMKTMAQVDSLYRWKKK